MTVHRYLALSGSLVAASVATAQVVAFDTLGPTNVYHPTMFHLIRGFDSPSGPFTSHGFLFKSEEAGTVQQFVTAFEHLSGNNNYTFHLRTGDANGVGAILGIWEGVQGGSAAAPIITIASPSVIGPAVVNADQTYWLIAIGQGSAEGRWFRHNSPTPLPATYNAHSSNGTSWFLTNDTQHRAMRVILEGDPQSGYLCPAFATGPRHAGHSRGRSPVLRQLRRQHHRADPQRGRLHLLHQRVCGGYGPAARAAARPLRQLRRLLPRPGAERR